MAETNGQNGRDSKTGRFLPGNAGGPGNPHAARVHALKAAVHKAVGPKDIQAVFESMAVLAKQGDAHAARLIAEYCLGRPRTADRFVRLALPKVESAEDLVAAGGAVAAALAAGELSVGDAKDVAAILDVVASAARLAELEQRLELIEGVRTHGDTFNDPSKNYEYL